MQKRPSAKIPPEVLARAIELRRAGKTVRAIAEEVGYSKSAIHEAVKSVGLGDPATVTADDLERAAEYEQNAQTASLVARAMIHDFGRRVNGPTNSDFAARDLDAVVRAAVGLARDLVRTNAGTPLDDREIDARIEHELVERAVRDLVLKIEAAGGRASGTIEKEAARP